MSAFENQKVMIIDPHPAAFLPFFRPTQFQTIAVSETQDPLQEIWEQCPDIILFDPEFYRTQAEGYTFCAKLREVSQVALIVVAHHKEPAVVVRYLELGADDYLQKPIDDVQVLLARIQARLRRSQQQPATRHYLYNDGYLMIDLVQRQVIRDYQAILVSPKEFQLLKLLLEQSPRAATYEQLLAELRGEANTDHLDYLRLFIRQLRRKIEPDPKNPRYILTIERVGYCFRKQQVKSG